MPLVLVENERTAGGRYDSWQDHTGKYYHFPNSYRTLVQPGERFVYYRGVRRKDGARRPFPEYFGSGSIGAVWRDETVPIEAPKRNWKWICSLSEYLPFDSPVPWMISGNHLEPIAKNLYGIGVRRISDAIFWEIIARARDAEADPRYSVGLSQGDGELAGQVTRSVVSVSRALRDTPLVRTLKCLHENTCQICRKRLPLSGGKFYSEAHHIRPLGRPHFGPDCASNLLIVCPDHHVLCDYGAIVIVPETLRMHPLHQLDPEHLRYHNEIIVRDMELLNAG